jgi:hypothetical protein
VREFVLDEDRTTPAEASLFSINMLVNTEAGRSFSYGEIAGWMRAAGLREIERPPDGSGKVIVGHRPA